MEMKIDPFVISTKNINQFNNVFFGKKLLSNSNFGNFIKLIIKDNEIKVEESSFVTPPIFYYQSDNFFAISNNLFELKKHLESFNINLSVNQDYINNLEDNRLAYQSDVNNTSYFKEINIIPADCSFVVKNNKINIISKKRFYIDIKNKESYYIIDKFYNNFNNFIKENLDYNIKFCLSGGLDSRILFKLLYNITNNFEVRNKTKKHPYEKNEFDGEISNKILLKYPIKYIKKPFQEIEYKNYNFNKYVFNFNNIETTYKNQMVIQGTASEPFRKNFKTQHNDNYFYLKQDYYYDLLNFNFDPYLYSELFRIKISTPDLLNTILYLLYCPEMLDFDFHSYGEKKYTKKDLPIEEAKSIIKNWNVNN